MRTPVDVSEVEVAALEGLLARIAPLLDPAEQVMVQKLVSTLLTLIRLVRTRGTTIARLRRLVGMSSSEKTAVVLGRERGHDESAAGDGGPSAAGTGPGGGDAPGHDGAESKPPSPESKPSRSPERPAGSKPRKGHGRLPAKAYPHAHHMPVAHESLRPGGTCPLCKQGKLYELDDPAHWLRIVGNPPLTAECWCCQRLRCCPCGAVFTARAPAEAQGEKMSDSAVALIALLRYRTGMPHHRLEQTQETLETPVPASSQFEALAARAEDIRPVHQELKRQAAQGTLMHCDDTRQPVLEFMGKRRAALALRGELADPDRTGLFTSAVISMIDLERKIALFMTGRQHAGENLAEVLSLRPADLSSPILMSDALSCNAPQGHAVIECHCLAHARRYFVDEVGNYPQECSYVLERLEQVFKVDALSRRPRLSDEQRLRLHQRKSGPVMNELEAWMQAQFAQKRTEPNSGLGRAINYMLKRWSKFTLFLRRPGAPLENNVCERALKAAIRHRNNSLFYRTDRGAKIGDCYLSILYTAEINGENPLAYLTALLGHVALVAKNPAAWLPWMYRTTLARMTEGDGSGQPAAHQGPPPVSPSAAAAARAA